MEAATMEAAAMKATGMEAATMKAAAMKAAAMEATAMKATTMKAAAMEAAASVKPTAPTMRTSVSEVRLAQCGNEQQSRCGSSQSPAHFGLSSFFT